MHPRRIILIAFITFLITILGAPSSKILNRQFIQTSFASQTDVALQSQQQPLSIYQPLLDIPWEGQFVNGKGIAYFSPEEVNDGYLIRTSAESDLQIAQTSSEPKSEATLLSKIGLGYHVEGEYDKAVEAYKQSLEITKRFGDHDLEVMLLGNLGLSYSRLGDYYEAINYLNEYWGYTWHKGYNYNGTEPRLGGVALANIGNAYYAADLYAKAIEYHQKRLALSQEIKDRKGEGKALGDIGIVYQALGDYEKAIASQQKYLTIARDVKDSIGEIQALSNLGITYQTLGDYAKASQSYQEALNIAQQIKNRREQAKVLSNLGGVQYFLGNYAKAIEYYEQAWAIAWNNINDGRLLYAIRGNEGLAYFQMGNAPKAIEFYQQYFKLSSAYSDRRGEGVARNNLALANLQSSNIAGAEKDLMEGIKVWESLRTRLDSNDAYKVSIFETQNPIYSNLQKVLVSQNKHEAALEISERGRARAFVELLARRLAPNSKVPSTITPPTIEQIKQIAKRQNSTLVEYSIIKENFKIQNQLQTHESELYIWVIKPTGEVGFRKADLKPLWQQQNLTLEDLVIKSRESIGARGRGLTVVPKGEERGVTQRLPRLYELLIQPIAELLPTDPAAHVIFIPQGSLFLVPFAALQDSTGKYLIEKHTILTAPSIQVLDLSYQQRQRVSGKDVLVVGNPTMPSIPSKIGEPPQQLSSLPGAEQEAGAIAQLLNAQVITGNQATKAAILPKLTQARIVHLATHGLMDDFTGQGIPGAIALAPNPPSASPLTKRGTGGVEGSSGLLSASEILDLKLKAELVVLSACDTGRGRITGDGVIGLSRSLIAAGAPSVIVSLWALPDASTAELMTEFYRNLQQNPDKAQALRNALLTTMKQYPDVINWGAFTLIGEAE
jgi:CHAT domain-containing protein/Tfp pilus assembly protein PilF